MATPQAHTDSASPERPSHSPTSFPQPAVARDERLPNPPGPPAGSADAKEQTGVDNGGDDDAALSRVLQAPALKAWLKDAVATFRELNAGSSLSQPDNLKGPNSLIWRAYLEEFKDFNTNNAKELADAMDSLLIFAALFSAVVTGLLAVTMEKLGFDHPEATNLLLKELILVQRALAAGGDVTQVLQTPEVATSPELFAATPTDVLVNRLWFSSLAFSLAAGFIGVLVKQWIQAYLSPLRDDIKAQAEHAHFRYCGIRDWYVLWIVGLLPIFLHVSLFLFFLGLSQFLFEFDKIAANIVTAITVAAYTTYIITNLLPVVWAQCPYKTPLSYLVFAIPIRVKATWSWLFNDMPTLMAGFKRFCGRLTHKLASWRLLWVFKRGFGSVISEALANLRKYNFSDDVRAKGLREMVNNSVTQQKKKLEFHAEMFLELFRQSSDPAVRNLVIRTMASPRAEDLVAFRPPLVSNGTQWARIIHRSLSAKVTARPLDPSFWRTEPDPGWKGFANLCQPEGSSFGSQPTDGSSLEVPVTELSAARQHYLQSIAITEAEGQYPLKFRLNDEVYDESTRVDWDKVNIVDSFDILLTRYCVHALYDAASKPMEGLISAAEGIETLSPVIAYCRYHFDSAKYRIALTPDALLKLRSWLPGPGFADRLTFVSKDDSDSLCEDFVLISKPDEEPRSRERLLILAVSDFILQLSGERTDSHWYSSLPTSGRVKDFMDQLAAERHTTEKIGPGTAAADLVALQPPATTKARWAQLLHRVISSKVTSGNFESQEEPWKEFDQLCNLRTSGQDNSGGAETDDRVDELFDASEDLLLAHSIYMDFSGIVRREFQLEGAEVIDNVENRVDWEDVEEVYNLTTYVDWEEVDQEDAFDLFLVRFGVHALYSFCTRANPSQSTQPPPTPSVVLAASLDSPFLKKFQPILTRYMPSSVWVQKHFLPAFTQMLPTPQLIDQLVGDDANKLKDRLSLLLSLSTFIFFLSPSTFSIEFQEKCCVEFWCRIYHSAQDDIDNKLAQELDDFIVILFKYAGLTRSERRDLKDLHYELVRDKDVRARKEFATVWDGIASTASERLRSAWSFSQNAVAGTPKAPDIATTAV